MERRTHFRSRPVDGQRVALRYRVVGIGDGATPDGRSHTSLDRSDWIISQARDLGVGGAFVATYRVFPIGTALEVEMDLPGPDAAAVFLRAQVRWLAVPSRLPPGCDPGMGLAFAPLDTDSLLALSEYLAALAREKATW